MYKKKYICFIFWILALKSKLEMDIVSNEKVNFNSLISLEKYSQSVVELITREITKKSL